MRFAKIENNTFATKVTGELLRLCLQSIDPIFPCKDDSLIIWRPWNQLRFLSSDVPFKMRSCSVDLVNLVFRNYDTRCTDLPEPFTKLINFFSI